MKKVIISFVSLFFCISCGVDLDMLVLNDENELLLDAPTLRYPTPDLVCTNSQLQFEWDAQEESENPLEYEIQISEREDFDEIIIQEIVNHNFIVLTLEKNTSYFWRIKVTDVQIQESQFSDIGRFQTEPESSANIIPSVPTIIAPQIGSITNQHSMTLSWNATDLDGDSLSYDIYFGKQNPPELFMTNLTDNSIEVDLDLPTKYYWRIAAKDPVGSVSFGQVWNFTRN